MTILTLLIFLLFQFPNPMDGTYYHINVEKNIYNTIPIIRVNTQEAKIFLFDDHQQLQGSIPLDHIDQRKDLHSDGQLVLQWEKEKLYTLRFLPSDQQSAKIFYQKLPALHWTIAPEDYPFPDRIVDQGGHLFFKAFGKRQIPLLHPIRNLTQHSIEYYEVQTGKVHVYRGE